MKPSLGAAIEKCRPAFRKVMHALVLGMAISKSRDPEDWSNSGTTVAKKSGAIHEVQ